ncbi:YdcF family protein [soil metagenome]
MASRPPRPRRRHTFPNLSELIPHPPLNSLFVLWGIESWKALLSAFVLPPAPFLVLVLIGCALVARRRALGWVFTIVGVALLWLCTCSGTAQFLTRTLVRPPPALSAERVAGLKADVQHREQIAIVVLGGGLRAMAPEYRSPNLNWVSLERLRYGIWLAKRTGAPMGFSGGIGWGTIDDDMKGVSEARTAAAIAADEFGQAITWIEDQSRDTRENAARSIALLKPAGITRIVLVTHGFHMPRAQRAFEEAARGSIEIEPAPLSLTPAHSNWRMTDWLPTEVGFTSVRYALHEILGRWFGA